MNDLIDMFGCFAWALFLAFSLVAIPAFFFGFGAWIFCLIAPFC